MLFQMVLNLSLNQRLGMKKKKNSYHVGIISYNSFQENL